MNDAFGPPMPISKSIAGFYLPMSIPSMTVRTNFASVAEKVVGERASLFSDEGSCKPTLVFWVLLFIFRFSAVVGPGVNAIFFKCGHSFC